MRYNRGPRRLLRQPPGAGHLLRRVRGDDIHICTWYNDGNNLKQTSHYMFQTRNNLCVL